MDNQNEIQLKRSKEEVSFSDVYRLLKKGAVILTISLIIGVILTTSILLVVREFVGTTNYETEITFASASISEDVDYNPSTNVNTLIKSSTIISNVLGELGYSEDKQTELIQAGLIDNLSAYASESKIDNNGVSYPYTVTLSLKKLSGKLLSKAQAMALIEAITKATMLELTKQYKYELGFSEISNIDYGQYNYLQVYDILNSAMESIDTLSSTIGSNVLNYKINGVALKSAFVNFENVRNEIKVAKLKLINNAIINKNASSSELEYANFSSTYYSQQVTQLSQRLQDYNELLKDTKPDITVVTGSVTIEALKDYYELVDKYNKLQDQYAYNYARKAEWEIIKDAYSGTTKEDTSIESDFNSIIENYNSAYKQLDSMLTIYNNDNYSSSLVVETKNVKEIKDSAISPLIIVLIDVVAILIIMIIVAAIEQKKEKKQK